MEKERRDQEFQSLYPERTFIIGKVRKVSKGYHLIAESEVVVEFSDVENVKKGIIGKKTYRPDANPKQVYLTLTPSADGYSINNKYKINHSKRKLPNSIDEFLAQYKYEPEKLD